MKRKIKYDPRAGRGPVEWEPRARGGSARHGTAHQRRRATGRPEMPDPWPDPVMARQYNTTDTLRPRDFTLYRYIL